MVKCRPPTISFTLFTVNCKVLMKNLKSSSRIFNKAVIISFLLAPGKLLSVVVTSSAKRKRILNTMYN